MYKIFEFIHNIPDNELKQVISEMKERFVSGYETYEQALETGLI